MATRTNTSFEEIESSLQNQVNKWGLSDDENQEIFSKVVGLQLKKLRLLRKKTQTRLANKIDVTFQQLQKYEKGTNECRLINLLKLSEVLDVELDYFYRPLVENNLKFLTKRERNGYVKYNEQIR
nr:transcription regulator [uncultured Mediterranean phage uvMED]|tara:strand:- start:265 stop:639 length:375 start_codon:yes stop_codon:yes gene_type:complete